MFDNTAFCTGKDGYVYTDKEEGHVTIMDLTSVDMNLSSQAGQSDRSTLTLYKYSIHGKTRACSVICLYHYPLSLKSQST